MKPVMWKLENLINGHVIEMVKSIYSIGRREQADLPTVNARISREHATIYLLSNETLSVADHKSVNGTYVNNKKISIAILNDGDILSIGGNPTIVNTDEFKDAHFLFKVVKVKNHLSDPLIAKESNININAEATTSTASNNVIKNKTSSIQNSNTNKNKSVKAKAIGKINIKPIKECDILSDGDGKILSIRQDKQDKQEISPSTSTYNKCTFVSDEKDKKGTPVNVEAVKEKTTHDECMSLFDRNYEEKSIKTDANISSDNKLEITQEKNCFNKVDISKETSEQRENPFTTSQNECIILSDEEDDDLGSSQIFQISEKIKEEPNNFFDGFDPYFEIKEELAYMDYPNTENIRTVDLTDDIDHFENTLDLLDILESSHSTNNAENLLDILGDEVHTDDPIETRQKNTNHDNALNRSKINLNVENHPISDVQNKQLRVSISRISKYKLPPIVEPHNDISRKTRQEPAKRKSVDGNGTSEETKVRKKRRHSTTNEVVSKPKQKVKELRRQKLKELASKNETNSENLKSSNNSKNEYASTSSGSNTNSSNLTTIKAPEKLKFSNIEYSSIDQNKASSSSSGDKLNAKKTRTDSDYNLKPITFSNSSDKSKASTSNQHIFLKPKAKSDPRLQKQKLEKIQDTTITSNANSVPDIVWLGPNHNKMKSYTPDSTVPEDRSGIIWKLSSNKNTKQSYQKNRRIDVDDEIYHLLCWNVRWLLEQKESDVSAPVYFDKPVAVPTTFNSFEQYSNVMSPLLKMELWQYIFQMTFENEKRREPFKLCLEHERRAGRVMYLDCEYIPSPNSNNMMPFRTEDYCLVEMKLKDSQNCYMYTCFGYIQSIMYSNKQNKGGKVTIIAKNCEKQIFRKQFTVKVCANIATNTRLFKTIKLLKFSPLSQFVLNPQNLATIMPLNNISVRHTPLLNPLQKEISSEASEMALRSSPGFYLIKGPPGTGKTSVIVSTVLEILFKCRLRNLQPRILLAAPSNTAIDGLILKLYQASKELPEPDNRIIKIVRVGPDASINELVNKFTYKFQAKKRIIVEKKLSHLPLYKKVVDNKMNQEEFLRNVLGNQYAYEYKVAEDKVLMGANIICSTLNSCISFILNQPAKKSQMKYTCCIIDEATQCNEIECLSPIQLGIDKFILVGDPQQLSAVICNREAQHLDFGKSLFARIAENFSPTRSSSRVQSCYPIKELCDQYRMKPEICDYPNRTFYKGTLKSFPKIHNPIEPPIKPYMLFNLPRNENKDETDYTNSSEVNFIVKLLDTFRVNIKPTCKFSIGIITPYRAQKELIAKSVANIKLNPKVTITINTVDSFQGLENDVIIISSVRYSSNYFLANEQRLNVALTRAKQALYIIGNYTLFKQCRPLYDLREDAKRRQLLFDIKDNPRNLHKYILS